MLDRFSGRKKDWRKGESKRKRVRGKEGKRQRLGGEVVRTRKREQERKRDFASKENKEFSSVCNSFFFFFFALFLLSVYFKPL